MPSFIPDDKLSSLALSFAPSLYRVAFTYVKNSADADDITQDVYCTYFEKTPVTVSAEHLKAWLLRVTVNKSRNYVKSSWYRRRAALIELSEEIPDEDREVTEAVLSLPEKLRTPVHLRYYENYSVNEIAEILKITPSAVSQRLNRAYAVLKKMLGGNANE